ncbi:MAG: hypothetical protein FWE14_04275 [Lachnospiraceae bacterium]|nr:hypothetical protein [Lachnospiraceae bacterium]
MKLTSKEKDTVLFHTGKLADMAAKDSADDKDFISEIFKIIEVGIPIVEKVVKSIF